MLPKAVLYWLILFVTFAAALWAIYSFSSIADKLESRKPENPRGLLPIEEGQINNSIR